MKCVTPSERKARRRQLLANPQGLPMQKEVRQQLGAPLAEVFFASIPPRARELMGLTPPLTGLPGDQELWVPPSDVILKGRVVLKLPATRKMVRAITHQGIQEIGHHIEQIFIEEQERRMSRVLEFQRKILDYEFAFALEDAIFQTRMEEVAKCEEQRMILLQKCDQLLEYAIIKCQRELKLVMLRRIQKERHEVEKLFRSQMDWRLRKQKEQLTEQLKNDHIMNLRELEFQFRAFLESQRNECCRLLALEANKFETRLKRQQYRWEARTKTEIAWTICEERRRCTEEKAALEGAMQAKIDELMAIYESSEAERQTTADYIRNLEEDIDLWKKRILEIIDAFQKFINCMTNSPPGQALYLLDIARLMTIREPSRSKEGSSEEEAESEGISLVHSLYTIPSVIKSEKPIPEVLLRESSSELHLAIVEPILYELIRTLPIGYELGIIGCHVVKRYTDNYFLEDRFAKEIKIEKTSEIQTLETFHPVGYCDCHIRFGTLYYNMDPSKCMLAKVASIVFPKEKKIKAKDVKDLESGLEELMDEIMAVEEDDGGEEEEEEGVGVGVRRKRREGKKKKKKEKNKKGKKEKEENNKKEKKEKEEKNKKEKKEKEEKNKKRKKEKEEKNKKGKKEKEEKKKGKKKKKKEETSSEESDEESTSELIYSYTYTSAVEEEEMEEEEEVKEEEEMVKWKCEKSVVINGVCTVCGTIIRDYCEACAEKLKMYENYLRKYGYRQPKLDGSGSKMICCECDSLVDFVCPGCYSPIGRVECWKGPSVSDVQKMFAPTVAAEPGFVPKKIKKHKRKIKEKEIIKPEIKKEKITLKKEIRKTKKEIEVPCEKSRDRLSIIMEIMRDNPSLRYTILPFGGL